MTVSSTRSGQVNRERLTLKLKSKYYMNSEEKIYPESSNVEYEYDIVSNDVMYGTLALMCPECFEINYADIIHSSHTTVSAYDDANIEPIIMPLPRYRIAECTCCGAEYVYAIPIDINIANAISLLNQKGFITNFSCEGHGKDGSFGYIMFKDSDIIDYVDKLAPTWFVDHDNLTGRYRVFDENGNLIATTVIRSDWFNYEESLSDLWDWVVGLPYKRKD